jgi:hypothetical protein
MDGSAVRRTKGPPSISEAAAGRRCIKKVQLHQSLGFDADILDFRNRRGGGNAGVDRPRPLDSTYLLVDSHWFAPCVSFSKGEARHYIVVIKNATTSPAVAVSPL